MINLNLSIGPIVITPLFWFLAAAFVLSSFSFWRRLREDFKENEIFEMTLLAAGSALFFSRAVFVVMNFAAFGSSPVNWLTANVGSNFSLPAAFLGAILAVNRRMGELKRNKWEVLDCLVLPFLYFLLLGGLGSFLGTGNFWDLAYFALGLGGILAFPFLRKNYRSFAWYKSGKTGFLITFYSLFLSLILLVLAFFQTDSLYLNRLLLLILFFFSIYFLYSRSERDIKEDLKEIFGKRRKHEPNQNSFSHDSFGTDKAVSEP